MKIILRKGDQNVERLSKLLQDQLKRTQNTVEVIVCTFYFFGMLTS